MTRPVEADTNHFFEIKRVKICCSVTGLGRNLIHFIEFAVAVTADTMSETKGGAGLNLRFW